MTTKTLYSICTNGTDSWGNPIDTTEVVSLYESKAAAEKALKYYQGSLADEVDNLEARIEEDLFSNLEKVAPKAVDNQELKDQINSEIIDFTDGKRPLSQTIKSWLGFANYEDADISEEMIFKKLNQFIKDTWDKYNDYPPSEYWVEAQILYLDPVEA